MKILLSIFALSAALLLGVSLGEGPNSTKPKSAERVGTNPPPISLVSTGTVAQPKVPLYVIKEVYVSTTPAGQFHYVDKPDFENLARLFGAIRLTNFVIYPK
jgi:hypothetical protein